MDWRTTLQAYLEDKSEAEFQAVKNRMENAPVRDPSGSFRQLRARFNTHPGEFVGAPTGRWLGMTKAKRAEWVKDATQARKANYYRHGNGNSAPWSQVRNYGPLKRGC